MKLLIDGYVYWVRPEQSLLDIIKEFGLITGKLSTDPIAAKIAGELHAEALISMTDISGILRDKDYDNITVE